MTELIDWRSLACHYVSFAYQHASLICPSLSLLRPCI